MLDDDVREPLLIHEDECLPNKAIRNHRRESVVRCGSQGLSYAIIGGNQWSAVEVRDSLALKGTAISGGHP